MTLQDLIFFFDILHCPSSYVPSLRVVTSSAAISWSDVVVAVRVSRARKLWSCPRLHRSSMTTRDADGGEGARTPPSGAPGDGGGDEAEAEAEADSKPQAATAMPSKSARASTSPGLRQLRRGGMGRN